MVFFGIILLFFIHIQWLFISCNTTISVLNVHFPSSIDKDAISENITYYFNAYTDKTREEKILINKLAPDMPIDNFKNNSNYINNYSNIFYKIWNKIPNLRHFYMKHRHHNQTGIIRRSSLIIPSKTGKKVHNANKNLVSNNKFIIADDTQPYFTIDKSIFSMDQFVKTFIVGSLFYSVFIGFIYIVVYSYYKNYIIIRCHNCSDWKISKNSIKLNDDNQLKPKVYFDDIVEIFCNKPVNVKNIDNRFKFSTNILYGRYDEKEIVIKEISCFKNDALSIENIRKHISYLKRISHNNFVSFIGTYIEPTKICMVYHQSYYGLLYDLLIEERDKLDFIFLSSLINDLINGMAYLHTSSFGYHGKLTSRCCYVEEPWCLKISDYGMRKIESYTHGNSSSNTILNSFSDYDESVTNFIDDLSSLSSTSSEIKTVFTDVDAVFVYDDNKCNSSFIHKANESCLCFSLLWYPPEILVNTPNIQRNKKFYQKADIYSFGVILQEMITLNGPFNFNITKNACQTISSIVKSYRFKNLDSHITFCNVINEIEGMQHFLPMMELCLRMSSNKRPSFSKLQYLIKIPLSKNGVKPNIFDNIMNLMTIYSNKMENLIIDTSGQLLKDKKKAEQLLCRMFPKPIISNLIRGLPVEPELFDQVTIYFSDIVGFTSLCSKINPFEVSKILHELYTRFDEIVSLYNVFKVETIGDAYMAVSGLPVRKGCRHATEICEMAINILSAVDDFSFEKLGIYTANESTLKIRIGIHTGPVAAGIVGDKMPRYCLFGETVAIAQQMEQHGTPQCILVSEPTMKLLENPHNFNIEQHNNFIFGKHEFKTYLIRGFCESVSNNDHWQRITPSFDMLLEQNSQDIFENETSFDFNTDFTGNMCSHTSATAVDDIFSNMSSISHL